MRKTCWQAATMTALMLWAGCAFGQTRSVVALRREAPAESKIVAETEVEYARRAGESLRLDLYRPEGAAQTLRPGIVFVHGGGWSGGNKSEFTGKAKEMAQRGYVAITVNYRLAPLHRYPAALEDVQQAVLWLREHAEKYHLDPMRIGAMGASAGGHLVAMLGVRDTLYGARERASGAQTPGARVNCVVDYYGRMDLNREYSGPHYHDYRPAFLGKTKAEAPELYTDASPIAHVDAKTAPFLIVQGARDPQVAPEQSQQMLEALDKAGVEASLLLLAEQGHGFQGAGAQMAWETARAFLDRHLKR